jgi:hypothetical protein
VPLHTLGREIRLLLTYGFQDRAMSSSGMLDPHISKGRLHRVLQTEVERFEDGNEQWIMGSAGQADMKFTIRVYLIV